MNFSVGPTVQNLTIFRGKNRTFRLGPKWLGMTQGVQKSLWLWAGLKIQLSPRPFAEATKKSFLKKKILKTEARDHFQTHFWVLRSHFSLRKFDSRSMWPSVPNLTEMDENPRKRNEILTLAQMTQNDPGSSKITSELTSDENSTFGHFCCGHEKSWKITKESREKSWKLKNWNIWKIQGSKWP